MIDFDNTIGIVMEFARKHRNTLVIVTADHETGGMGLNEGSLSNHEVKAAFTSGGHTSVMVPVFTYGPGAENFGGIQENTDLFYKMMEAFGFKILDLI
jgi:alkaline phosphatase